MRATTNSRTVFIGEPLQVQQLMQQLMTQTSVEVQAGRGIPQGSMTYALRHDGRAVLTLILMADAWVLAVLMQEIIGRLNDRGVALEGALLHGEDPTDPVYAP